MKPIVIGISGGSGSGKTTFARLLHQRLCEEFSPSFSAILGQDHYYIDQSAKFRGDGDPAVNFDHPSAIDFALIAAHLNELKQGRPVQVPVYDFASHTRAVRTDPFHPCSVVIADGMLLLSQSVVLPFLDYRIFVDAPEAIRYERRLARDVKERGRTPEGVEKQFRAQVKPMHDQFIEPSKHAANEIISGLLPFEPAIARIIEKLIARAP